MSASDLTAIERHRRLAVLAWLIHSNAVVDVLLAGDGPEVLTHVGELGERLRGLGRIVGPVNEDEPLSDLAAIDRLVMALDVDDRADESAP